MLEFDFLTPNRLDESTAILEETGGCILAGGTDLIPKMRNDLFFAPILVDLSNIDELSFIEEKDDQIVIGALTTHQAIAESALLKSTNPALVTAAGTVGCVQTRNRGTLGGNIANASPAADSVPPLLVYDAQIRLLNKAGERTMPLTEFLVGPGMTKLESGELIHSVSFSQLQGAWGGAFQKLGVRNGMAIAVVSVAAAIVLDASGKVSDTRLALGSVASTVVRSPKAESALIGHEPTPEVVSRAAEACAEDISPISDVRSTAEYRRHAAIVLARRVLEQAAAEARGRLV
ncbi:MAG: xanthine dehydrogenase family protein subunit M [Anaerolineales bacterium]|nr:xanthine dehydrogenase family protein subunit M [Anaerolineales bacterium]